jgi:hypothetical protein
MTSLSSLFSNHIGLNNDGLPKTVLYEISHPLQQEHWPQNVANKKVQELGKQILSAWTFATNNPTKIMLG